MYMIPRRPRAAEPLHKANPGRLGRSGIRRLRTSAVRWTSTRGTAAIHVMRRALPPAAVDVHPEVRPWRTVNVERVALVAAHTVASLMRLEDIIPLIEVDPRVQLVFTQVPDQLGDGVERRLSNLEVRVIPWEEATQKSFDLA